jgi:hypothetical protein
MENYSRNLPIKFLSNNYVVSEKKIFKTFSQLDAMLKY